MNNGPSSRQVQKGVGIYTLVGGVRIVKIPLLSTLLFYS